MQYKISLNEVQSENDFTNIKYCAHEECNYLHNIIVISTYT